MNGISFLTAAVSLLGVATSASAVARCNITQSEYTSTSGGQRLIFKKLSVKANFSSDLAVGLSVPNNADYAWFGFDRGSARYINLISIGNINRRDWSPPSPDGGNRPYGVMHYLSLSEGTRFTLDVPTESSEGPDLIILPDLQDRFYYSEGKRVEMPSAVYKRTGCRQ